MGSNPQDLDSRALLGRILGVLGVASLGACVDRGISETGDEAADEMDAATGSESGDESSTTEDGDDESESEVESDTTKPHFDLGQTDGPDSDGNDDDNPWDCDHFLPEEELQEQWVPPIQCLPDEQEWYAWDNVCFYPPDGVSCESEPFPAACIIDEFSCGLAEMGQEIGCGPFVTDTGACCYVVWGDCPVGRPWIVEGRARRAALADDAEWADSIAIDSGALDPRTRVALADAWASEGLGEHASVASFARFTLHLLALGAPPALVEASIRAELDEVRHARACFALASAYAERPIGPGSLDVRGGLDEPLDLDEVALSLAAEGCIAETVSAILLAAARDRARDPAVRDALAAIYEDELEHVLLAWEALAWMCRRGARIDRLAALFRQAEQHVGFGATTELPGDPLLMREHGYLPLDERRDVAARALADVVAPAARELFASLAGVADQPSSAAS
jgi:hypothetical protein